MNELDIVDRLSIHRTMSQYSTIDQLIFALNCDRSAAKKEIESLRKQQAASVPDGWKLVPTEATEDMLNAMFLTTNISNEHGVDAHITNEEEIWSAIIAAAPSPVGLDNPEVPKQNDKYTFVIPDASMTKIRYIFVDGEMVYENLESEQ